MFLCSLQINIKKALQVWFITQGYVCYTQTRVFYHTDVGILRTFSKICRYDMLEYRITIIGILPNIPWVSYPHPYFIHEYILNFPRKNIGRSTRFPCSVWWISMLRFDRYNYHYRKPDMQQMMEMRDIHCEKQTENLSVDR